MECNGTTLPFFLEASSRRILNERAIPFTKAGTKISSQRKIGRQITEAMIRIKVGADLVLMKL
jgi:hypothetical protein